MSTPPSHRDPKQRFSDRVDYYVASRPSYPIALLDFCREKLGLRIEDPIADVGSGTGILSRLFLQNGHEIFAIEPNADMRRAAEREFAGNPKFHSVDATAEKTSLPDASVRAVIAGQAFHWFDKPKARDEFRRILSPGGWAGLIWNDRRVEADDFSREYERIIEEASVDLKEVRRGWKEATGGETLNDFFGPGGCALAVFDNPQSLDLAGIEARALSSSYLPLPGQPGCDVMLEKLRKAFERYAVNGRIVQGYETRMYYGSIG
jgi:SAM-dependent methyltransferase